MGSGGGDAVLVHHGSELRFRTRLDLLAHLTGARPYGQVWLTPRSPSDWRVLVLPLLDAGWRLGVNIRKGILSSIRVFQAGERFDGSSDEGVIWSGRSAAGILDVEPGLSPADEARATLEAVTRLDQTIRGRYPSVSLSTSLTATALEIFRTYLPESMSSNPQIDVTLRHAGAVGGGRQELYVLPGTASRDAMDLDIASAYPTALALGKVGVEYDGPGTDSQYGDPSVITFAAVDVPDSLVVGPLRANPERTQAACYPTGTVVGAWSGSQIKAAEALGCKVRSVGEIWRFIPCEAFAKFGEEMSAWRKELRRYSGSLEAEACKRLAVQAVGGWLMNSRKTKTVAGEPESLEGVKVLGNGLFEVPIEMVPHKNAMMPAGILTIGLVQAWSALVLGGATRVAPKSPIYWHTDGGAFTERAAVEMGLAFAEKHGAPGMDAWKLREISELYVWAPGQRFERYPGGDSRVVGSGISRSLGALEVLRRMESAELCAERDRKESGLRPEFKGYTRPPRMAEIAPRTAQAMRGDG